MQGLLLLNKPEGITSFSAVSAVKRIAGEKRVGHTGTLDPMATGVLPILLGRATVLSGIMLDADKRYTAKIKLGTVTDTDDITGEIITRNKVDISEEKLKEALAHFTGRIKQTPPMYSAIKKDGVRLYKLAREGKTAEIPSRDIEIYSIDVLKSLNEDFEFVIDTHVSKGTYIRSLARDIGEYLGCGATLAGLERTYASGFNISECMPLDKLSGENIGEYILSEEKAVSYLPQINVTEKQAVRFSNGGQLGFDRLRLDLNKVTENELFRVKFGEKLLGIGFADCERAQIGIKCILNYPE
ncbi:MAG: tRNA pseudouridine(55) synthase TruB [Acutalibacteraceae bacterium]|nr:tRNA pseudouridine(55) synthase TruB [Acutalibacteraceae bacterium]